MHVLVKGEERETETDTEREEGSDTVGAWVNINKREKREKRLQTKERRGKKRLHTKRHKQNRPALLYSSHHKLPPPSLPPFLPPSLSPSIPDITMQLLCPVLFMLRYTASESAKMCGSLSYISRPL